MSKTKKQLQNYVFWKQKYRPDDYKCTNEMNIEP